MDSDPNELRLRTLLMDIGEKLSNDDRVSLSFLLANDVPRRILDTISRDSRASMNEVWKELIDRQKITPDNVNFLIDCFTKIRRIDLARKLSQYSTTAENRVEQPKHPSPLFVRINPKPEP